jgi:hypothetical protein
VKPYLERGIFVRLQNRSVFQAVRVIAGSVEWPGEIDLSYDTLYLESQRAVTSVTDSSVLAIRDEAAQCLTSQSNSSDAE